VLALTQFVCVGFSQGTSAEGIEFFEKHVRPLLVEKCLECHSASKKEGGLSLGSRDEILTGGDSGPAVDLANLDASRLLLAIRYKNEDLRMPPSGPLGKEGLAVLEKWVHASIPDPRSSRDVTSERSSVSIELGREFWSFQPIADVAIPLVPGEHFVEGAIDTLLSEQLSRHGLEQSGPAPRGQWLRRVSLDLLGIPPDAAEIEEFEQDTAPDAFERVVDRLLNSPQYGVRWGRHWLDVARYSDSNGLDENLAFGTAWRYRDYVIHSWNSNKPFDQFVREQIAGDLLDHATPETHVGTGFLVLGAKVLAEPDRDKLLFDTIDEQIDTVGKAFLGLTLGCVRCHDHKFDPILQSEYYSLAAIFQSTRTFGTSNTGAIKHWNEVSLAASDAEKKQLGEINAQLKAKQAAYAKAKAEAINALRKETREKVLDYLRVCMQLASDCSLLDCEPLAIANNLHPRILLNCRLYLARFSDSSLFRYWNECVQKNDVPAMQSYYASLFSGDSLETEGTTDVKNDGNTTTLREIAKKAISDSTGFLAVPAKLEHALDVEQINRLNTLAKEAREFESSAPDESSFMGVVDGNVRDSIPIHVRGSHRNPGATVKRSFPSVLVSNQRSPLFRRSQSGRLELAQWLTDSNHPLTARVFVNRLWRWHFGRGIVATPDNFGRLGASPSHPELLDYLARELIESGWRVKELQRSIVLSSTYRMSSAHSELNQECQEIDPENTLLWHFPLQRLDAEQVRDSVLHVAGLLDYQLGGKTVPLRNRQFVFDHTSIDHTKYDTARRTAYFPIIRNNLAPLLQQFDYPDPTMTTGHRATTTVAPQSLLLLNADWVLDASENLSRRVCESPKDVTPQQTVTDLYRAVLGRSPSEAEIRLTLEWIESANSQKEAADSWMTLTQNLLIGNEFFFAR
jgi:hypothetical protein